MAIPKPVPSLSEEEFAQFRQNLTEFEASEEMEKSLEAMRELKGNSDS